MKQKERYLKGQTSIPTYIALFITFIISLVLMPALNQIINDTATALTGQPNQLTGITILVIDMIPFTLIFSIVLTAINYATPRREGIRG